MKEKIIIEDKMDLYDKYSNYIYSVGVDNIINIDKERYILFNPSIHYWITLDEIGIEIVTLLQRYNNIGEIKKVLIEKYNINNNIFNEDVIPIIDELVNHGFFTNVKTNVVSDKWMDEEIELNSVDKYPFNEMYISLSDKCNLNCVYCFNKEDRKLRLQSKERLDFHKIVDLMKEFKELNGTGIVFTGGEPTLNKELLDLCKKAKEIGLNPHFITNGTLLEEINLEDLFQSVDQFGISLDSVVQEEIDILWDNRNKVLVDDIIRNLKKINEYSKNNKKFIIRVMPIVSKINKNSLTELIKTVEEILCNCDVSWQFTQYGPIGNAEVDRQLAITEEEYFNCVSKSFNSVYTKQMLISGSKTDEISKINNQIKSFAYSESGRLLPPTMPKVLTCAPSFFVANNGDVYPCQGFEKKDFNIGNVNKSTLTDLFSTEGFSEVRKRIIVNNKKECRACELRFVCTNKCGGCITSCNVDKNKCRDITIKRLFLQTQLS